MTKQTSTPSICIPLSDCCNARVSNYRGEYSAFGYCKTCGKLTTVHEGMTKQTSTMKYRITFFTDGKKVHEETFATKEEMDRRVAEIEGKPKQTDWKCDHCKFMNPKQENTCLACGISPQSAKSGEIDCTHGNAVKWNPYNEVVQCHKCGQVFVSATELDAVRKEVAEEMTNMMANTHKRFFDSGWEKGKEDERREILALIDDMSHEIGFGLATLSEVRSRIEKRGEK